MKLQNEMEVLLSVLADTELLEYKSRIQQLKREEVYTINNFPLSLAGLNYLCALIDWTYWCRRDKGVRIVEGKVIVCELEDSPFYHKYERKEQMCNERSFTNDTRRIESRVIGDTSRASGQRSSTSEIQHKIKENEQIEWI